MRLLRNALILVLTAVGLGCAIIAVWHWFPRAWLHLDDPQPVAIADTDLTELLNRLDLADLEGARFHPTSPKILLVTLDTTRADHLSTYGYPVETTPFLTELAREGHTFRRVYAVTPMTIPAHSAMFTGLYPAQNRMVRNSRRLPMTIATLPEILAEAGYSTGAAVSVDLFRHSALDRGFEFFDEPTPDDFDDRPYRPADATVRKAREWLSGRTDDDKVFFWLHLFDAHEPFTSHPEVRDDVGFERRRAEWLAFNDARYAGDLGSIDWVQEKIQRYDEEIRFVDNNLRALFESVPELLSDYLVIVTADHGEGLNDHGYWGHSRFLFEEQIRVPLVMRWPDGRYTGSSDRIVEQPDLMASVLWAAGIDAQSLESTLRLPVSGTPLQWRLDGRDDQPPDVAFTQQPEYDARSVWYSLRWRRYNLRSPKWPWEEGQRFALIEGDQKYVLQTVYGDRRANLSADPLELRNLLHAEPAIDVNQRSRLEFVLRALRETAVNASGDVPAEALESLRALGYIQ